MAEQVGQPLRHQHPQLLHRAAQFQDPHIEARLGLLHATPVVGQLLLGRKDFYTYIHSFIQTWLAVCFINTEGICVTPIWVCGELLLNTQLVYRDFNLDLNPIDYLRL